MIRKRKFFYISGFDPRGYRYYREVLKEACITYGQVYDDKVTFEKEKDTKDSIIISSQNADTSCSYEFLGWDDVVRRFWIKNPIILALQTFHAYFIYILNLRWSLAHTLSKGPIITLFFPIVSLVLFIVTFTAFFTLVISALNIPLPVLWGLLIALPLSAIICKKIKSLWLLYFFIFNAQNFTRKQSILDAHYDHFIDRIISTLNDPEYDEVICCAHSNGSILMFPLLERLIARHPNIDLKRFKILTLGQCIPLASYLKNARNFHGYMEVVKKHPFLWCDLSSPADSVCFALHNVFQPHEGDEKVQLIQKSPQFHKYFSTEDYKLMRKNKFKMHFAYLDTPSIPSPYGIISLMLSECALEGQLGYDEKK